MPLITGNDQTAISQNIKQLVKDGYKHEQAIAIALSKARRSKNPKEPPKEQK